MLRSVAAQGLCMQIKVIPDKKRLLLELLTRPIASGTEYGTAPDSSMVIKSRT